MNWNDIEVNVPLNDCTDSLLFEANDVIATLKSDDGVCVSIAVAGEVRIVYDGEVYRYASDYPAELTNAIKEQSIQQMEADGVVEILENNWFEVSVMKNGEIIDSDVWETPFDNLSNDELKKSLIEYVEGSYPELSEHKTKNAADKEERA